MKTSRCENCGTITNLEICSNCQEELAILEFQWDGNYQFSKEFLSKANDQLQEIKKRKKKLLKYERP